MLVAIAARLSQSSARSRYSSGDVEINPTTSVSCERERGRVSQPPAPEGIAGRIVSVAAIIAVAVNTDGKREIVGLHIGPSEAETFWLGFLKSLARRGLRAVKLVISDAHEGLKAAIRRVFGASWQRCRVHWMRKALS